MRLVEIPTAGKLRTFINPDHVTHISVNGDLERKHKLETVIYTGSTYFNAIGDIETIASILADKVV